MQLIVTYKKQVYKIRFIKSYNFLYFTLTNEVATYILYVATYNPIPVDLGRKFELSDCKNAKKGDTYRCAVDHTS